MHGPLALNDALLRNTSLTEEGLAQALRKQEESGRRLTELLLELELVEEDELLGVLGGLYHIPVRETLEPGDIDSELATKLPIGFAKQHHVLPLRQEHGVLEVAISDPLLTDPLDDLRLLYPGLRVSAGAGHAARS